jgi:hypothetical protein
MALSEVVADTTATKAGRGGGGASTGLSQATNKHKEGMINNLYRIYEILSG